MTFYTFWGAGGLGVSGICGEIVGRVCKCKSVLRGTRWGGGGGGGGGKWRKKDSGSGRGARGGNTQININEKKLYKK